MREQLFFTLLYQMPSLILGLVILRLKVWLQIRFFLLWPGTVLHEVLHWVVAFLTNGRPKEISVWPRRSQNGHWTLGTVVIANLTWYNGLWISLAPILGIGLLLVFTPSERQWHFSQRDLYQWGLSASVWVMCWPSQGDWGLAFKSSKGICLLIALALLVALIATIVLPHDGLLEVMKQL